MPNKELQEERMRGYFIQATKEILKGEGLKGISVRNIADQAGYSYATLYNYFKDVKELIFECVKDFQEECHEHIEAETASVPPGVEKLKARTISYIKFFIQYPGIFELFYLEKPTDIAGSQPTLKTIASFLDRELEAQWTYCVANGLFSEKHVELKKEQVLYVVTGLLLLYQTRRYPTTYREFASAVERQLEIILS